MNKIRAWLSHPRLPIVVALLAIGLTLPSLWNGLNLDDYYHRLVLLGDTRFSPSSTSPLNLFCFYDGNPEENRRLMKTGMFAWFYSEQPTIFFFSPPKLFYLLVRLFLLARYTSPDAPTEFTMVRHTSLSRCSLV